MTTIFGLAMESELEMTGMRHARNRRPEKSNNDEEEMSYGSRDQRTLATLGKKQVLKVCRARSPYNLEFD